MCGRFAANLGGNPGGMRRVPRTSGYDCVYTEIADARGLDFIYTEIADTNWSLGDSRGDDIAFVSSQMQAKFRRRFRVVFS